MFYTDLYTKDEVIVQLEVWQESTKVVAIIESTRSIFQEFVSKAVQWVGGPHYFNNSFPGPNLQPRFQSKLKSQLTSSVATASLNQGLKLSIFDVQKATAPKSGVEFRQGSIGTIRGSLATPYDVWRPSGGWVGWLRSLCVGWVGGNQVENHTTSWSNLQDCKISSKAEIPKLDPSVAIII